MYVLYVHIFSVSSSVTDAQVIMITAEDVMNTTYSITITCTIHPDSTADMCEVTIANGQTLTGEHIIYSYVLNTYIHCRDFLIRTRIHTYHKPLQYT